MIEPAQDETLNEPSTPIIRPPTTEGTILFAETSTVNHNKLKRRGPLMESRISNTLSALGESMRKMTTNTTTGTRLAEKLLKSSDAYGGFIMWMPEPSLPSRYSGSIEMPSRDIQLALIDQYFSERHESIGMMIKYHFYEQLETKGLLITPLLLNVIYAHASRFVTIPGCPKTEVFYHRARRLVDDFMDVPRVSTIVALCLLSLYEPSPAIYRPGSHHCRQWQYSGMACRMSLELGLYDDSNVHTSLTSVEIELRRRVFWGCYDLDKFQSSGWERPWMISRSCIRTQLPTVLPQETEEDAYVTHVYNAKLAFVNIVEDNLILFSSYGSDPYLGTQKDTRQAKINENLTKHQVWLRSLEANMQWTPVTSISVKEVLEIPAARPMINHLHLYYNSLTLDLLSKLTNNSVAQFQSRVTAASMTQLAHHLCQTPSYVVKFDFIVHALIAAIKIHIRYLDDTDVHLAQQAWLLFDRSIWCMQLINSYAVIPNCLKFLQQVQNIYGLHMSSDTNYSSSSSPSPKLKRNLEDPSPQQSKVSPSLSQPKTQTTGRNQPNNNSFPDDLDQILTDWPSATEEANSRQEMVYLNTHNTPLHSHYQSYNNVNISTHTPPRTQPQQQQPEHAFRANTYTSSSSSSNGQHQQHQQRLWDRYKPNLPYDRDIVVPSQLNEENNSVDPPMYGNTAFTNSEDSIWQASTSEENGERAF